MTKDKDKPKKKDITKTKRQRHNQRPKTQYKDENKRQTQFGLHFWRSYFNVIRSKSL
jgi:hypothetical protein